MKDTELMELGGPNDYWHIAERHEPEDGDGPYFEIINYAKHDRIYLHDTTKARAVLLAKLLNKEGF